MTAEEKSLIIGALFHDIGKFEQRCTNEKTRHEQLGYRLLTDLEEQFTKILGDSGAFNTCRNLILNHHNRENNDKLINYLKEADYLSASERVEFSEPDADLYEKWSHKFLSSLFSKIYLNNPDGKQIRYYEQKLLTEKNYKILIPEYDNENDIKESGHKYNSTVFDNFRKELKAVLEFYEKEEDFYSLINLLLILFEKYMWCVPDFTGSELTDISLFNHLKDVTGISHATFKSDKENNNLNLIIGDLPGIQKYIFNVANKNPAKALRGRSIFVQNFNKAICNDYVKQIGLNRCKFNNVSRW